MFKRLTPALASAALLAFTGGVAVAQETKEQAPELKIGDHAPDLEHVTWVKGDPVTEFQSGEIYVLDFWATWCGPCIAAIPHMNEVAQEYEDQGVNVIAVAVFPRPRMTPVEAFVESKGDEMDYTIAEDVDGKTATRYMSGTMSSGIPTVMIVNREGKLAWIGHPMVGMDEALEQMVEGEFDLAAAAEADEKRRADLRAQQEIAKKIAPYEAMLQQAYMSQDWDTVLTAIDKIIAVDPERLANRHVQKYEIVLTQMKDKERAKKVQRDILGSALMDNAQMLNYIAWMIVEPNGSVPEEMQDLDFALELAEKADTMTEHGNASIIDTLARVHYRMGDLDKAIELQKTAIEKAPEGMKASLEATLDEYQQAKS